MPGKNPDPADTLDILEVIRETYHRHVIPEITKAITDSVAKLIPAASAPDFHGFTVSLPLRSPVVLLGADRQRIRTLVRGNTSDIFIGSLNEVQAGFGYPVPTFSGDEIKVTGEVYVIYNPEGTPDDAPRIAVWIERTGA